MMDAKEFELPIEGSLSKLAILHTNSTHVAKESLPDVKKSKASSNIKKQPKPDTKKKK